MIEIENIQEALSQIGTTSETSLFNLIVYSPSKARTDALYSMITRVAEKFPCRILLIEKSSEKDVPEVKVNVSKEKFGKRNSKISCDLISIVFKTSEMERIPFIVLPNILADLPVYLIWGEDPTATTKILEALQSFSMRLIFDAAWADHLTDFSLKMLQLLKNLKIETMDISFGLLSGWKDVLANVFDSKEKIANLQNCKKISIKYSYEKPQDALKAIYLQGFIASKMKWELKAEEMQHETRKALCYSYKDHDINVILERDNKGLQKGAITELEIVARNGDIYAFNASKNPLKVILHISSENTCEMPCTFSLPDVDRGFNFLKEIVYQVPGDSYKETLKIISKVNWEK